MVINTIIFTLLGTVLSLLNTAIISTASVILNKSAISFTSGGNFFEQIIGIIPFAEEFHLAAIVKGMAYGLILLLLIAQTMKSTAQVLTGDTAVSPIQSVFRAAVAVVLITLIFGVGGNAWDGDVYFNGLLGNIGSWFNEIISVIKAPDVDIVEGLFGQIAITPGTYLMMIFLEVAVMVNVVGAALSYLERLICFALYVIFGPLAVAMYTSKDTAHATSEWLLGLISNFMAIFISLIMWALFLTQMQMLFKDVFAVAIALTLLTLVKNSDKIVNAMGLKAMKATDSANAIMAGGAMVMMAARPMLRDGGRRITSSIHDSLTKNGVGGIGSLSIGRPAGSSLVASLSGTSSAYTNGIFGSNEKAQQISKAFANNPFQANNNAKAQNSAMNSIKLARAGKDPAQISARSMNTALGIDTNKSQFRVVGDANGQLRPATMKTTDGRYVRGYVGNAEINRGGSVKTIENAFFPVAGDKATNIQKGSRITFDTKLDGEDAVKPLYTTNDMISADANNHFIYQTSTTNPLDKPIPTEVNIVESKTLDMNLVDNQTNKIDMSRLDDDYIYDEPDHHDESDDEGKYVDQNGYHHDDDDYNKRNASEVFD